MTRLERFSFLEHFKKEKEEEQKQMKAAKSR